MDSNDVYGLVYKKGESRWDMQEKKVPLESASVDLSIKGFIADVTSTLTYRHEESEAIEAAFVFPMDEQSAVYHFQAEIDGRVIVGECQTKAEAQQTYDTAVETGHTAFLMNEEKTSDVFRIIIGNLPPKKVAEIKFSYVIELPIEVDDSLKFVLPTVLNPRYGDPGSTNKAKMSAPLATAEVPNTVAYKFSLKASVFAAAENKIAKIVSDTHQIQVGYEDKKTKAKVQFGEENKCYSDLRLNVFYEDMHRPQAIYEAGSAEASGFMKQDVVMLNFFPKTPDGTTNSGEYIFVVDRSGSMSGSNIDSAKETLLLFLKSLPVGCYFNVVSFGSRFEFLFKQGSALYNQANLKTACSLQKDMEANFGGTEILQPLAEIYRSPCKDGHPRQIFLLTDGDIWDTENVIQLVKKNAHNTRVFTFGIGAGASTALVKGVARAGRGMCEFVQKSEKLQSKVINILKQARQDYTSDVKLNWKLHGNNTAASIPKEVPPIFTGQNLIMYGLLKEPLADGATGKVELSWKVGGKQMSHELEIIRGNLNDGTSLHRLAGKKKIQELQQCETDDETNTKEAIVLLSTSANIVSNHTSFVAVDKESKVKVQIAKQANDDREDELLCLGDAGLMACNSGPVLKGGGFLLGSRKSNLKKKMSSFKKGVARVFSGSRAQEKPARVPMMKSLTCVPPPPPSSNVLLSSDQSYMSYGNVQKKDSHTRGFEWDCEDSCDYYDDRTSPEVNSATPPPPPPSMSLQDYYDSVACDSIGVDEEVYDDTLIGMIDQQAFDGHWELSKAVVKMLGKETAALKSASPVKDLSLWATAVVLAWLELRWHNRKDEWEMLYDKAYSWLKGQGNALEGNDPVDLVQAAKKALE